MSSLTQQLYAEFQKQNPENKDFNENLINWRKGGNDDIAMYLQDIFKALEVIQGIEFISVTIITDESKFPTDVKLDRKKNVYFANTEISRLNLAEVKFKVSGKGETGEEENVFREEEITLRLFVPKFIDYFFLLNSNIYYPIFQLVDKTVYHTKKTLTLKTLLMPIVFRTDIKSAKLQTFANTGYIHQMFVLELFGAKTNVFQYFFAAKGFEGTLEYFGAQDAITVEYLTVFKKEEDNDQLLCLRIRRNKDVCLVVKKEWLDTCWKTNFVASIAEALVGVDTEELIADDTEIWCKRFGRLLGNNPNMYVDKAKRQLVSLERILDERTKRNLSHLPEENRTDIYAILKWMMVNLSSLTKIDNMCLSSKRIRLAEYLVQPLLYKFSENTYRLLNSKKLTFKSLERIFKNISPMFVVNKLVVNELLRFSNGVNQHDLFQVILRFTLRGQQSMGEKNGGDIPVRYRGLHPSYLGNIGLASASASDPGLSGMLTPFAKVKGQFFNVANCSDSSLDDNLVDE